MPCDLKNALASSDTVCTEADVLGCIRCHFLLLQKRILWVTCGKIRGYPIGGSVTVNFGQLLLDISFVLIII